MLHPISRTLAAVAAILVLAVWLTAPRHSIAFGDLLAPIVNAKSAKYKLVSTNDAQPGMKVSATGFYLAPNRSRVEVEVESPHMVMVSISDFERGRIVTLIPETKEAMIFQIEGKPDPQAQNGSNFFANLIAVLADYRNNQRGQLEELGEKRLDGHRAFGFRLTNMGMLQTIWGDADTGRVIRIEGTYKGPPKTVVVMSDFEFDVPLDASLFALDVPEGYKITTVPVNAAPPNEAEFLDSLQKLTDAVQGEFPASLDTPGISLAVVKLFKGKEDSKEQFMREGVAIGRGINFAVMLPPDSDAHYAGKGVKRDGPKTPIFWYKPAESKTYRVIWSDLSVSDDPQAPDVPGAIRMNEPPSKPSVQ